MTTDLRRQVLLEMLEYMYDQIEGERVSCANPSEVAGLLRTHLFSFTTASDYPGPKSGKRARAEALACTALTSIMGLIDLGLIGAIPRKGGPADGV